LHIHIHFLHLQYPPLRASFRRYQTRAIDALPPFTHPSRHRHHIVMLALILVSLIMTSRALISCALPAIAGLVSSGL